MERVQIIEKLLETTQEGFWNIDNDGRTVDLNPAMCGILGRRRDEVMGKTIYEFVDAENEAIFHAELEKRRHGHTGPYEVALQRPDGSNIPCINNATPIFDDDGVKIGSIGLWTDISVQKKIEAEGLAQTKLIEFLHTVSTIANEALEPAEAMRRCLRATCTFMEWGLGHVYERSPENDFLMIPTGIWYLAEADTFSRFRQITEHTVFQSGEGLPGRVMASRKPEWVEDVNAEPNFPRARASGGEEVRGALGFPVLVQGEVVAILEMFSSEKGTPENHAMQSALDHASTQLGRVVERSRTAEQLVEAKTYAETANRAKSEFLSAMSHELRTPLNAILGFAQVLRRDRQADLSAKQERSIGHIMKSGRHLLDLISQILELSKIEAGKLDLSMETINSSAAIEDCMTIAHSMAERYGVTVLDETRADNIPAVYSDGMRFKQVLVNLLSNAVKYNRPGGSVTVTAMPIETGLLRISVADTGEGIAAEYHARLFEPFDRIGRECTEIEGTGIGLAISRQLMDALGGAIDFESRVGEGSTFWIDLPLADGDTAVSARDTADMAALDAPLADQAREYRVMYVEDNLVNLQLMQAIFETIPNADLIVANDAETGISIARSVMPDIVLMDIGLPGMSGVAATNILKGAEDTRAIPVIAISAAAMVSDLERADSAGFSAYITKPIDIAETLSIINDVLLS